MLQRRLGERGSRETAVDETDTKKAGAGKIGHREVAVAENDIGQMGMPPHHPGEAASGETAARDGKMVAGKSRDVTTPEGTAGDLLFAGKKIGRLYRQGRTGKLRFGDFDLGIHKIQTSMQPSSRRIERLSGAPPAIEPTIHPASASSDRTCRSRRRSSSRRRAYL